MSDDFVASAATETVEAAPSEAPPTSDLASLSDSEVYDREPPKQAEGEEPVEATPAEAKTPEEKQEDTEDIPEHEEAPENYRNAFKKFPELRRSFYAEKEFRSMFPQISEAREYKALYPTLEAARQVAGEAESVRHMDNLFNTDPGRLLAEMHQVNPQAFRGMTASLRDALYPIDPEAYRTTIAQPVVTDVLSNLMAEAQEMGGQEGEDLLLAAQIIAAKLKLSDSQPARTAADDDPRIKEYESIKAREQEFGQRQWAAFGQDIDNRTWNILNQEIDVALSKANKAGALPGVLSMVRKEVAAKIWQDVHQNGWANQRMPSLMKEKWGRPDEVAAFKMGYARPRIMAEVQAVMRKLTTDTVEKSKSQIAAAKQATSRKDIGGGAGASSTPSKADLSRFTDDELYEGKHRSA